MSAAVLAKIQVEAFAWQRRNFGEPNALVMLCGAFEEFGEATDGIADTDEYVDGVSDCCIFLMQFCSTIGWDVGELWSHRKLYELPSRPWPILLGRISHSYVKGRVSHYRGTQAEHDVRCRAAISALLRHWEEHLASMRREFVGCVEATWAEVAKRDWAKEREASIQKEGDAIARDMARACANLKSFRPTFEHVEYGRIGADTGFLDLDDDAKSGSALRRFLAQHRGKRLALIYRIDDEEDVRDTERPPAFPEEPDTFAPVSVVNDSDEISARGRA